MRVTQKPVIDRWRARPVIAGVLRIIIVGIPLAAGYLASLVCLRLLRHQIAQTRWWLVLAVAVSVLVCLALERVTRRLLPLAALLKLSMLFPDRAPSRFKVARRALSVERLAERAGGAVVPGRGLGAEQALALITALTAHDRRTRGHSERVRLFTELLGEQLRLPREARDRLRWASLLHDIGKLQVAVEILNKPAKLNNAEWDIVAAHPGHRRAAARSAGRAGWASGAARSASTTRSSTAPAIPTALAGTDICRAARIVSIADSYEVMTAHRAYKKPMATVAARAELARCAGTQFDPTYVRAFLAISLPRLLWAMGPGVAADEPAAAAGAGRHRQQGRAGHHADHRPHRLGRRRHRRRRGDDRPTGSSTLRRTWPRPPGRAAPVHATAAIPNTGRPIAGPSTPKPVIRAGGGGAQHARSHRNRRCRRRAARPSRSRPRRRRGQPPPVAGQRGTDQSPSPGYRSR